MQHKAVRFGKKGLALLATIGVIAGLFAPTWLSAQADPVSMLGKVGLAETSEESKDVHPSLSRITESATIVYLPLVTRKAPPPPPVFGVQMPKINKTNGLVQAVAAGMHWVRFSAFRWHEIEPLRTDPPTYQWAVVNEENLLNAQANGMEPIAIIHFTPDWAQKYPGSQCGTIKEEALDEFAEFVTAVVKRYSLSPFSVRYWELWNEPDTPLWYDSTGFGCWGDENDEYFGGGYYAEMLKVAYPAIKAADPRAQVLIGGLLLDCDPTNPPAGKDCKASRFLEGVLRNDGGPYFDVLSFHAYTYYVGGPNHMANANWPGSVTAVPEKTAFLRDVLAQYGYEDKVLMNTEAALLCSEPSESCREAQAMYVPRAYAEALALGLKAQIYFALINEWWWHSGLLLPDLTSKPAYHAYLTAASFLTSVRYQGEVIGYPPQIEGYSFHRSNTMNHVDVIWSVDGSERNVALPAGASAHDRYGDLISSSGVIQVGFSPVYIVRP